MGLFNRDERETPSSFTLPDAYLSDAAQPEPARSEPVAPAAASDPVPHVNISMSTYGAPVPAVHPIAERSIPAKPRPPAAAPAQTETLPGLPDNMALQQALRELPAQPENTHVMNVMRQALQGTLFLRVRGDAKTLLAAGKPLNLAVSTIGESQYLLAFSGGTGLQDSIRSDADAQTSAIGQPAANVLRNVVDGPYAGLVFDHSTDGARMMLPLALVQKALEEADPTFAVKTLLCAPRTAETAGAVGAALATAKLWAAGNQTDAGMGLAEARTASGIRRLEIYSHPLEVLANGRADTPVPMTPQQLGRALAGDAGLTGVLVDPAGPWIELDRNDLAPVIALAGS